MWILFTPYYDFLPVQTRKNVPWRWSFKNFYLSHSFIRALNYYFTCAFFVTRPFTLHYNLCPWLWSLTYLWKNTTFNHVHKLWSTSGRSMFHILHMLSFHIVPQIRCQTLTLKFINFILGYSSVGVLVKSSGSWLAEQKVMGSIPGIPATISEIGLSSASKSQYVELSLKRRKSNITF